MSRHPRRRSCRRWNTFGLTLPRNDHAQRPSDWGDGRAELASAFHRHAELDASRVVVETADGKVTLTGTVSSLAEKRTVQQAAWDAPGVSDVDDQLEAIIG